MMNEKRPPTGAQAWPMKGIETATNYTASPVSRQAVRVSGLLHVGSDSPVSCRELASLLGWEPRAVSRAIECERRSGTPILAGKNGYYLPASASEVDDYLGRLAHREQEISRTRAALAATRQVRMNLGGGE